jgi:hypothetical protein
MSTEIEQRSPEEIELLRQAGLQADGVTPIETDPAASETPAETIIETPAINPPPPVAPEVHTYEYQPTDESGRPMGGRQVIKYTTQEELADKLRDNSILILRKLREETRNNRLGISNNENISDEAPRFKSPVVLKPRALTEEEKYRIATRITDPSTFDEAADELLEARMGAKPEVFAQTVNDLQAKSERAEALAASEAFMQANPGFVKCDENAKAITSWITRYGLAPVKENFQKAYETLKAAGVLIENLTVEPPPPPPPLVVTPPVAPPVETPVETPVTPPVQDPPPARVIPPAGIGTGLTRDNSSPGEIPARPAGDEIVYDQPIAGGQVKRWTGLQAIDRMPADLYRHRLKAEQGFAAKVDKLEAARGKKK